MDVLARHHSTLEELFLDGCTDTASAGLVQLLRSGDRLQRLWYTDRPKKAGYTNFSGLKNLKELVVLSMETRIGEAEVRWMAEQWPRLRAIRGIGNDESSKGAKKWLQPPPQIAV